VVDMTDGANVYVRLGPIEFLFCHVSGTSRSRYALYPKTKFFIATTVADSDLPTVARTATSRARLEPMTRIELVTSSLPRTCSAN
jgi:hypothetical protein